MKRLALAIALLILSSHHAIAQDAVVANAKTVHLKLENARVRVLESMLKPGQKENLHSHPSSVVYIIDGGTIRNHTADGKVSESVLKAGDVIYRDPLTHWAENIGRSTIRLILVELKEK